MIQMVKSQSSHRFLLETHTKHRNAIRLFIFHIALWLMAVPANAQHVAPFVSTSTSQAFDVASIKPSDPRNPGFSIRPRADDFIVTNASLFFLISYAYDVHTNQIIDAPAWTKTTRFDIAAKMDSPSIDSKDESVANWKIEQSLLAARLRSLLADRFQLRIHESNRELPVYDLMTTKANPKLKPSREDSGYTAGNGSFVCSNTSMDGLAALLSGMTDRIVLDKTNLTGGYEFSLKWKPDYVQDTDSALPGLFTALAEQLDLKLVPAKAQLTTIMIDHIEIPSKN